MPLLVVFLERSEQSDAAVQLLASRGAPDPWILRARSAGALHAPTSVFGGLRSLAQDEDRCVIAAWLPAAERAWVDGLSSALRAAEVPARVLLLEPVAAAG